MFLQSMLSRIYSVLLLLCVASIMKDCAAIQELHVVEL